MTTKVPLFDITCCSLHKDGTVYRSFLSGVCPRSAIDNHAHNRRLYPNVAICLPPDVGRVSDWHKAAKGATNVPASAEEDPGVVMTSDLKNYFVTQGLATEVMAASFRSVDQIVALAGCDHLTIGEELRVRCPTFLTLVYGLCGTVGWNAPRVQQSHAKTFRQVS